MCRAGFDLVYAYNHEGDHWVPFWEALGRSYAENTPVRGIIRSWGDGPGVGKVVLTMLRGGRRAGVTGYCWGLSPASHHTGGRRAEAGRGRRQDVEFGRHPAPHRRRRYRHRAAAPCPTTSPTAADLQDLLINNPCRGPAVGAEAEICRSESICHIDSDLQISSSTLAPHPSRYQLDVVSQPVGPTPADQRRCQGHGRRAISW